MTKAKIVPCDSDVSAIDGVDNFWIEHYPDMPPGMCGYRSSICKKCGVAILDLPLHDEEKKVWKSRLRDRLSP